MFNFLNVVIGWIMKLCYSISFNNYILTLFFFALIMQVILFPFGIKQQKSSVKLASIRPKEQAIRNKYRGRNDRATQQKMNMEIQEMYKAEGYSPTAGCLPLLIQLPIIFALFGVARAPLTYTTDLDKPAITMQEDKEGYKMSDFYQRAYAVIKNQKAAYEEKKIALEEAKKAEGADVAAIDEEIKKIDERITNLNNTLDNKSSGIMHITDAYRELKLIKFMQNGVDTFIEDFTDENGKFEVKGSDVVQVLGEKFTIEEFEKASFVKKLIFKQDAVSAYEGAKVYDFNDMLADKKIVVESKNGEHVNNANALPNFEFIAGTSTLDQPSFTRFDWLLIIPILVFLSSFWSGEVTRKLSAQAQTTADGRPAPGSGGFMRWGMPLMSTYFSLTFPAAIGIYWIFRSIVMVIQQFVLSKMYPAPVFTEAELKVAVSEEVKAKKRKKLVTIEVDEDDTSYDELAISEERAEKIRRRQERQQREMQNNNEKQDNESGIDKPTLKDD